ncbi:hypothetical protein UlMin_015477 [Ulmus minor]
MLGTGNNLSRGSATALPPDVPPLQQCLPLEPIALSNPKYPRPGELRRALGVSSTSEDHSFGVSHLKPPARVGKDELKHIKETVQNGSRNARDRAKMLRESIFKLDKYKEAMNSKKRQRSDLLSSERPSGALVKMGSQIHRNPHDPMNHRLDDRAKSVTLNKRIRTSIADQRTDSKSATTSRHPMFTDKDVNSLQAVNGSSRFEEKTRRLLAGGEGLDNKIKKKRSVGAVGNRVINGDREIKRVMQPKLTADSKLRSCDSHGFRLKSSPGVSGTNKLDGSFEPINSDGCTELKSEHETVSLPRDRLAVLEQNLLVKGSNKPNIQQNKSVGSPNTVTKGKVSRAPRTSSVMALDTFPGTRPPSVFQTSEQPTGLNKVAVAGMALNPKRPASAGSPIHPMAQWVGQRPHKNSRTRRTNLVSPVSTEPQNSSPGLATSDFSARTSSMLVNSVDNKSPKVKRETENLTSPYSFSESEESGAGENKIKEKKVDTVDAAFTTSPKVGSLLFPMKKNKIPTNEIGDGLKRHGRSGRGSSLGRPGIPPVREKSRKRPIADPPQDMLHSSDKNRSKTGRPPSKKLKDCKALTRLRPVPYNGSSDFTGESDDDHEELYLAATAARNASSLACSSAFWKKMEYIFTSVSSEDASYLKQQLRDAEELSESLSQIFGDEFNGLGIVDEGGNNCFGKRQDDLFGRFDMRSEKVNPLYQRVLSALIVEDESDDPCHPGEGKNISLQYASDDSHCGSCNQIDIEVKDKDRMESEVESKLGFQSQKSCLVDRLSSDSGAAGSFGNPSMASSLRSNEQWQGDDDYIHSDVGIVSEICSNDLSQLHPQESHIARFPTSDCQYQSMGFNDRLLLELQSIGLYPEILPDLTEGEDVINEHIMELKEGLHKQIISKKKNLGKVDKAIQKGKDEERRKIEQVAMDQLIQMAYRKRMACRGSNASKSSVRKVSKQVALACVKRTLTRCWKFEESSISCFSDPALQDVMFGAPSGNNDTKSIDGVRSGTASNEALHQAELRGSGAVSCASERYESHCDNLDIGSLEGFHGSVLSRGKKREVLIDDVVGSASSRVTSVFNCTPLQAKGKRSDREKDQNTDSLRNNTKPKSKQKNGQSSSETVRGSSQRAGNGSNKEELVSPMEEEEEPIDFSKLQFDPMEDLGVSQDLGGHQDFSSWLNFDDGQGLQDLDTIGLEIPMDDLSDLMLM